MLKLFRTIGQYVTLNVPNYPFPLRVTVLAVSRKGAIELGFEAPSEVLITHEGEGLNPQESDLKTEAGFGDIRISKISLSEGQYVTLKIPSYEPLVGVVVLDVSEGGRGQLGFEAPREVLVSRDDEKIKQFENGLKAAMGLYDEQ